MVDAVALVFECFVLTYITVWEFDVVLACRAVLHSVFFFQVSIGDNVTLVT